jgi:signal transduction histidine kinase
VSIKAKQVAGVTLLVVAVVMALSAYHMTTLARLNLEDTASRGQMLKNAIFQRVKVVVAQGAGDPYEALREDGGIQSIISSASAFSKNVGYVAIVNKDGIAIVSSLPQLVGQRIPPQEDPLPQDFLPLAAAPPIQQLRAVYSDQTYEINEPMVDAASDQVFGSIRIGVSTTLLRGELREAMRNAAGAVLVALILASAVAMLLSQWMLRPIHVIQSGLSRLGRGELDVTLDLKENEFRDLGSSFEAVSAQLSALGRGAAAPADARAGASTDLESVMDNLEDAVALFSPRGELIFCNKAMTALHAREMAALPLDSPVRQIVERTIAGRKSQGPISVSLGEGETAERLLVTHAIEDTSGRFLGAMLVARNLGYLSQVYSTLNYSRKLAALGRLMAGVAHEVKNPLNAMTIHLELLKQKLLRQQAVPVGASVGVRIPDPALREPQALSLPKDPSHISDPNSIARPDVTKHVDVIGKEIRRLDEVVTGFLKFARPDELKLQPVRLPALISEIATSVAPEAQQRHVVLKTDCADTLPEINADPGMLSQALLNLALNACQAMPNGGTLKLTCRATAHRRVEIDVEDTGVGIPPEHLKRIFDLYFTTKEKGSGIGLSMVYRIVQLHDGDVEVQSTPGHGTRFRLIFPQA